MRNMKSPLRLYFRKTENIPNSHLPVLLFRNIAPQSSKADVFRRAFRKNGWVAVWTDTVYDYALPFKCAPGPWNSRKEGDAETWMRERTKGESKS